MKHAPPKTKGEVVTFDDRSVMKLTLAPGWKWSEHVKPTAGTPSCQVAHLGYVIAGRMRVVARTLPTQKTESQRK